LFQLTFTFIKGVVHAEGRLSADQLVAAGVALVGSVLVKVRVKFNVIVAILRRLFDFFRSQDLLPPLPYFLLHLFHPLQLPRDPRLALIAATAFSLLRTIVAIIIAIIFHDVTMTSVILAHDGVTQEALVQQVLRLAFLLHDDVKVGPVELELVTVQLGGSEHFVVFVVIDVVLCAAAPGAR
jgi:hypothetical protein